jgi:hypothetical protein
MAYLKQQQKKVFGNEKSLAFKILVAKKRMKKKC